MYNNYQYQDPYMNPNMMIGGNDDRFFIAPFLLGGLAGGALGYGIASNNNQQNYYQPYPVPVQPVYPYPCPNCPTNNYYYYQ